MRHANRVAILALVALGFLSQPAGAAAFNAHFAGWEASGPGLVEVSAEFTVPVVARGTSLNDWVGLGGGNVVLQAGGLTFTDGTSVCWWEDYPYNDQVVIPGLRCNMGDLLFVDVAQAYYGPTQSRVIVEDLTSGQSSGWLSVYTPELASNPVAQAMVEANDSLGPDPAGFFPISFSYLTAFRGGYAGGGGQALPFSLFAYFGLVSYENSLGQVVPGVTLGQDWAGDVLVARS
jgi:hypothetical protein